jgi:hypothetical protein
VAAAGVAAGMLIVTIGISMTTLAIAWADVIRPELVMPVGLAVYVIKFALIAALLLVVADRGWAGGLPMAWSMAVGVVVLTGVQVMWLMRIVNRRLPS